MEIEEVKKEQAITKEHAPFYSSWKSVLFTTHHTDIGILYLTFAFFFFFLGGASSLIIRYALISEGAISPEAYAGAFTLHGVSMLFLFIIPAWAGFGNWLVPKYIGAKDMYFPKLNALGFWLLPPAGLLIYLGMPNVGWTMYAPLSVYSAGWGMDLTILGLHLIGTSSIIGAINFIVTIMKMKAPSVTYRNMPLMVWTQFTTAFLQVLATPVLAMVLTLLLLDRNLGTGFFRPELGGDPLLWQHLFWFYSHPAVYIFVLPAMGLVSQILPSMSRQKIFGYSSIAVSTALIGFLGFGVWAHHMWVSGISLSARIPFMFMTMAIAVPSGVKIFNWIATMYGGKLRFSTPMLFCLSFILSFIFQGVSGVFLANISLDYNLHETYFVVSHLHYVLFGASAQAAFAGMYYFFPYMTGRKYNETLGMAHFLLTTVGLYTLFTAMLFVGLEGMVRRSYTVLPEYFTLNVAATFGAVLIAVGALIFGYNMLSSWYRGPPVANKEDPWTLSKYGLREWPE
jgi:heme/copper-type cytochrome/quinol oxidase subunit 1